MSITGVELSEGTITPAFDLAVTEYTVTIVVGDGEDSVTYTVVVTRLGAPEIVVMGYASYEAGLETVLESGSTVDFGSIPPDADLAFTILNDGTAPLTLTGGSGNLVIITNGDGAYYSVLTLPASSTIPVEGTTTFVIKFESRFISYGTKTATLTIANDDNDEGTFTLSLTRLANCG